MRVCVCVRARISPKSMPGHMHTFAACAHILHTYLIHTTYKLTFHTRRDATPTSYTSKLDELKLFKPAPGMGHPFDRLTRIKLINRIIESESTGANMDARGGGWVGHACMATNDSPDPARMLHARVDRGFQMEPTLPSCPPLPRRHESNEEKRKIGLS